MGRGPPRVRRVALGEACPGRQPDGPGGDPQGRAQGAVPPGGAAVDGGVPRAVRPAAGGQGPGGEPRLRGVLPARGVRRGAGPRGVLRRLRPLARLAPVAAPLPRGPQPGLRGRAQSADAAGPRRPVRLLPPGAAPGPGRLGQGVFGPRRPGRGPQGRPEGLGRQRVRVPGPRPAGPRAHRPGPLGAGRPRDRAQGAGHAVPCRPAPGRGDPTAGPRLARSAALGGGDPRGPRPRSGRREARLRVRGAVARLPRPRDVRAGGRLGRVGRGPSPGLRPLARRVAPRREAGQHPPDPPRGAAAPGLQPLVLAARRRVRRCRPPRRHLALHGPRAARGVPRPRRGLGPGRAAGRRLRAGPGPARDAHRPAPRVRRPGDPPAPRHRRALGPTDHRLRTGPRPESGRAPRPGRHPRPLPGPEDRGPLLLGRGAGRRTSAGSSSAAPWPRP